MKLSDLDVSETLKFLVTYSGVFLASAYVAGRIYLQTYFSVFQLDPIVLDFEPQDIAFQSRSVWVPIGVLIVLFPIRFNANKLSKVIALPRIAIILLAVLIVIAIRTGMDIVLYSVSDWRGVLGGNLKHPAYPHCWRSAPGGLAKREFCQSELLLVTRAGSSVRASFARRCWFRQRP